METPPAASLSVVMLVRDLMFAAKITATARAVGVQIQWVREPDRLGAIVGDRLIVDLNQPGAIPATAAWRQATGRPVIGFVSHVDQATTAEARAAGIDRVVARSYFVDHLDRLLTGSI